MRYDKLLVVDLEATCWKDKTESSRNTSEIIEIGVVVLNLVTKQVEKSEGILIKPVKSKVSEFCTELTTLTQEMVDAGLTFEKACERLRKQYDSSNYPWVSYGAYDRNMMERQCRSTGVTNPFSDEHLNVKLLYTMASPQHRRVGMEQALAALNIPMDGTHHRGVDDALNITKILQSILK